MPNKTFNFDLQLPVLEFKGDYSIALKLLIKISGTGKFVGSFSEEINFFLWTSRRKSFSDSHFAENSLAKVKATGETSDEGITKFLLSVKLKVEYASFEMERILSGFGNKLINDNYKMFLDELVPGLESSLSRQFSDIVNQILKDSTYEEMFPE